MLINSYSCLFKLNNNRSLSLLGIIFLFISSISNCADNSINLTLKSKEGNLSKAVDANITELVLSNADSFYAYSIDGLDKLKKLRKLELVLFPYIEDLGFLSKCSNLQILIIHSAGNIRSLPSLSWFPKIKHFVISTLPLIADDPNTYLLNLKDNPEIEFLQISECNLTLIPNISNVPSSLKYINFAGNKITSIKGKESTLTALKKVPFIFLEFNPIKTADVKGYQNIYIDRLFELLPTKMQYTY